MALTTKERAVLEYSVLAPRRFTATLAADGLTFDYPLPPGTLGIDTSYAMQLTEAEFLDASASGTTSGYLLDLEAGLLRFTVAPTEPILVVFLRRHLPDDQGNYPTIPAHHEHLVEQLERAATLDAATLTASGPSTYKLGQLSVERGSTRTDAQADARYLRQSVRDALRTPGGRLF